MTVHYKINTVNGPVDMDQLYIRKNNFLAGNLYTWGNNSYGQLGTGDTNNRHQVTPAIGGTITWRSVACGYNHSAGIKSDGTLWMWGHDNYGELGLNETNTYATSSPVQTICGGNDWKHVACGYHITAAIKFDGSLWTWGVNGHGQLGDGTGVDKSSPVQTIAGGIDWKQVVCGLDVMAAIKTDGTLWLWGDNTSGQLGDGTNLISNSGASVNFSPKQIYGGGTDWKQVALKEVTGAAIKTDGTLWVWGRNNYGQLGTNTNVDSFSPIQTIVGGNDWKQVSCGYFTTMAIKNDGSLWSWGSNDYGQLGNDTYVSTSSPVQVNIGDTYWRFVDCNNDGVVAAIKTNGSLWMWGSNYYGELALGDTYNRSTPVQTGYNNRDWITVSCGYHTLAITTTIVSLPL